MIGYCCRSCHHCKSLVGVLNLGSDGGEHNLLDGSWQVSNGSDVVSSCD